MKILRKFGKNSSADDMGYDLSFLLGWLENLVQEEGELIEKNKNPKYHARLELAEDGLCKLQQVYEMGREEP